jgi:F-type H+-transporting ATPase subunit b
MDLNATLLGQLITFALLVWFTMKYVWPPINKTIQDREEKIASGLEAAELGKRELEMAEHKALTIIREAKQEAQRIIDHAHLNSAKLLEEAKALSQKEGARIIEQAQGEIASEITQAKAVLRTQLATLVITGAGKIIERDLDAKTHDRLLNELVAEI